MTISEFAEEHRLRVRRDVDGTAIIPGKLYQSHIYDHGEGLFGVMIIREGAKPLSRQVWGYARRAFRQAGMRIVQNGDYEGAAVFDPHNTEQAKVAIKYARVRRRRQLSEPQREVLRNRLRAAQQRQAAAVNRKEGAEMTQTITETDNALDTGSDPIGSTESNDVNHDGQAEPTPAVQEQTGSTVPLFVRTLHHLAEVCKNAAAEKP